MLCSKALSNIIMSVRVVGHAQWSSGNVILDKAYKVIHLLASSSSSTEPAAAPVTSRCSSVSAAAANYVASGTTNDDDDGSVLDDISSRKWCHRSVYDSFSSQSNMVDVYAFHLYKRFKTAAGENWEDYANDDSEAHCFLDLHLRINIVKYIVRGAAKRLETGKHLMMAELLLCEAVHQLSLCNGCQEDNKLFISAFRTRFAKQQHIAQYVWGPLLVLAGTTTSPVQPGMTEAVSCFGAYGYVHHSIAVPHTVLIAAAVACDCLLPPNLKEGGGESTVQQLLEAFNFISTKCEQLSSLRKRSRPTTSQNTAAQKRQQEQEQEQGGEAAASLWSSSSSSVVHTSSLNSSSPSAGESPSKMRKGLPLSVRI